MESIRLCQPKKCLMCCSIFLGGTSYMEIIENQPSLSPVDDSSATVIHQILLYVNTGKWHHKYILWSFANNVTLENPLDHIRSRCSQPASQVALTWKQSSLLVNRRMWSSSTSILPLLSSPFPATLQLLFPVISSFPHRILFISYFPAMMSKSFMMFMSIHFQHFPSLSPYLFPLPDLPSELPRWLRWCSPPATAAPSSPAAASKPRGARWPGRTTGPRPPGAAEKGSEARNHQGSPRQHWFLEMLQVASYRKFLRLHEIIDPYVFSCPDLRSPIERYWIKQ